MKVRCRREGVVPRPIRDGPVSTPQATLDGSSVQKSKLLKQKRRPGPSRAYVSPKPYHVFSISISFVQRTKHRSEARSSLRARPREHTTTATARRLGVGLPMFGVWYPSSGRSPPICRLLPWEKFYRYFLWWCRSYTGKSGLRATSQLLLR